MNKFLKKMKGWATGRGGMNTAMTVLIILTVMFLNAILYSLTASGGWYLYEPPKTVEALSGSTDRIFEGADEEVTIVFLREEEDMQGDAISSTVYQTATALAERHSFISLEFVNFYTRRYYDEELEREVVFPVDRFKTDMRGKEVQGFNEWSVVFIAGDITDENSTYHVLPSTQYSSFFTFDSAGTIYAYNGEEVLASMVSWVLSDEHPTAYLTTGHGEMLDSAFTNMLTCAGYYLDLVDLSKSEVPADAELLIVFNPTSDFEYSVDGSVRTEIDRLGDYMYKRGGDLYVCMDPELDKRLPAFESFLAERGFVFAASEEDGSYNREIISDPDNGISTDGYTFVAEFADNGIAMDIKRAITERGVSASVLAANMGRIIIPEGSTAVPILTASSGAETYAGGERKDREGGYAVCAYNDIPAASDVDKRSSIFVCYGTYVSSAAAMVTNGYSNKDFMFSVMNYGFGSTAMPIGCVDLVFVGDILQGFTMSTARLFTALIMAIPVIIGIVGAVIVIRRKYR